MLSERLQTISIDQRYRGLPGIALGGYSSGLLAAHMPHGAEVKLRRPVPLGRELTIDRADDGVVELRDGEMLLAEAGAVEHVLDVPPAPRLEEVEAASAAFPGHHRHPYPECFACGPQRAAGDGLRIFPGTVPARRMVATPWTPPSGSNGTGTVGLELIWGAFDCAQLWAMMLHEHASPGERAVTAKLEGALERDVRPGAPHVLVAWPIERDAGSLRAGAALFGPDGELCATGVQTAVVAKWGVPLDFEPAR
jgi:hypothetical protein